MSWTNRYHDKWPRLTALFNLEQQQNGSDESINGYDTNGFPPPGPGGYYRYYVHPDDMRPSRSMSAYSLSQRSNDSDRPKKTPCCRVCLGTMLVFSLAAVISVSVVLAILWTEPNTITLSSNNDNRTKATDLHMQLLKAREKEISANICKLMDSALQRNKLTTHNEDLQNCSISLTTKEGHMHINLVLEAGHHLLTGKIEIHDGKPEVHVQNRDVLTTEATTKHPIVTSTLKFIFTTSLGSTTSTESAKPDENIFVLSADETKRLSDILGSVDKSGNSTTHESKDHSLFDNQLLADLSGLSFDFLPNGLNDFTTEKPVVEETFEKMSVLPINAEINNTKPTERIVAPQNFDIFDFGHFDLTALDNETIDVTNVTLNDSSAIEIPVTSEKSVIQHKSEERVEAPHNFGIFDFGHIDLNSLDKNSSTTLNETTIEFPVISEQSSLVKNKSEETKSEAAHNFGIFDFGHIDLTDLDNNTIDDTNTPVNDTPVVLEQPLKLKNKSEETTETPQNFDIFDFGHIDYTALNNETSGGTNATANDGTTNKTTVISEPSPMMTNKTEGIKRKEQTEAPYFDVFNFGGHIGLDDLDNRTVDSANSTLNDSTTIQTLISSGQTSFLKNKSEETPETPQNFHIFDFGHIDLTALDNKTVDRTNATSSDSSVILEHPSILKNKSEETTETPHNFDIFHFGHINLIVDNKTVDGTNATSNDSSTVETPTNKERLSMLKNKSIEATTETNESAVQSTTHQSIHDSSILSLENLGISLFDHTNNKTTQVDNSTFDTNGTLATTTSKDQLSYVADLNVAATSMKPTTTNTFNKLPFDITFPEQLGQLHLMSTTPQTISNVSSDSNEHDTFSVTEPVRVDNTMTKNRNYSDISVMKNNNNTIKSNINDTSLLSLIRNHRLEMDLTLGETRHLNIVKTLPISPNITSGNETNKMSVNATVGKATKFTFPDINNSAEIGNDTVSSENSSMFTFGKQSAEYNNKTAVIEANNTTTYRSPTTDSNVILNNTVTTHLPETTTENNEKMSNLSVPVVNVTTESTAIFRDGNINSNVTTTSERKPIGDVTTSESKPAANVTHAAFSEITTPPDATNSTTSDVTNAITTKETIAMNYESIDTDITTPTLTTTSEITQVPNITTPEDASGANATITVDFKLTTNETRTSEVPWAANVTNVSISNVTKTPVFKPLETVTSTPEVTPAENITTTGATTNAMIPTVVTTAAQETKINVSSKAIKVTTTDGLSILNATEGPDFIPSVNLTADLSIAVNGSIITDITTETNATTAIGSFSNLSTPVTKTNQTSAIDEKVDNEAMPTQSIYVTIENLSVANETMTTEGISVANETTATESMHVDNETTTTETRSVANETTTTDSMYVTNKTMTTKDTFLANKTMTIIITEVMPVANESMSTESMSEANATMTTESMSVSNETVSTEIMSLKNETMTTESMSVSTETMSTEIMSVINETMSTESTSDANETMTTETSISDANETLSPETESMSVSNETMSTEIMPLTNETMTTESMSVSNETMSTEIMSVTNETISTESMSDANETMTTESMFVANGTMTAESVSDANETMIAESMSVPNETMTTESMSVQNEAMTTENMSNRNKTLKLERMSSVNGTMTTEDISVGNNTMTTEGIFVGPIKTEGISFENYTVTTESISVGNNTMLIDRISVGNYSQTTEDISVGNEKMTTQGISVGYNTMTTESISVGTETMTTEHMPVGNYTMTTEAISIGNYTMTTDGLSVGNHTMTTEDNVGNETMTTDGISVGNYTMATEEGISVGNHTITTDDISVENETRTTDSISVGKYTMTTEGISLGNETMTTEDISAGHYTMKTDDISVGNETMTTEDISYGNYTMTTEGIFVGNETMTTQGISVGNYTMRTDDISVGNEAMTTEDISVGNYTMTTESISVGSETMTTEGISVGNYTMTNEGISVGNETMTNEGKYRTTTTVKMPVANETMTTENRSVSNETITQDNSYVSNETMTTEHTFGVNETMPTKDIYVANETRTTKGMSLANGSMVTEDTTSVNLIITTKGISVVKVTNATTDLHLTVPNEVTTPASITSTTEFTEADNITITASVATTAREIIPTEDTSTTVSSHVTTVEMTTESLPATTTNIKTTAKNISTVNVTTENQLTDLAMSSDAKKVDVIDTTSSNEKDLFTANMTTTIEPTTIPTIRNEVTTSNVSTADTNKVDTKTTQSANQLSTLKPIPSSSTISSTTRKYELEEQTDSHIKPKTMTQTAVRTLPTVNPTNKIGGFLSGASSFFLFDAHSLGNQIPGFPNIG